jgi:hypothetical protein
VNERKGPGDEPGPFPHERENEMPEHFVILMVFYPGERKVTEFRHLHFGGYIENGKGQYYV